VSFVRRPDFAQRWGKGTEASYRRSRTHVTVAAPHNRKRREGPWSVALLTHHEYEKMRPPPAKGEGGAS
jgi:hypothetical protein